MFSFPMRFFSSFENSFSLCNSVLANVIFLKMFSFIKLSISMHQTTSFRITTMTIIWTGQSKIRQLLFNLRCSCMMHIHIYFTWLFYYSNHLIFHHFSFALQSFILSLRFSCVFFSFNSCTFFFVFFKLKIVREWETTRKSEEKKA